MLLKTRGLEMSPDMIILGFAANDAASPSLAGLPWESYPPEAVPNPQAPNGLSVSQPPPTESSLDASACLRDALWQRSSLFRFAMRRWHTIKIHLGIQDRYDPTTRRYFDLHDALIGRPLDDGVGLALYAA